MAIRIEPIQETDFEELVILIKEFATFQKLPEKMTNSAELMKDEINFIHGFVAKNEVNKIIGYTTFFFSYHTWVGKCLYMDDLYITQEYRGKNLGTTLINTVIAFAKSENCKKLRWQVSNWNHPAIAFYKSLGTNIDEVENNCDLVF